MLKPLQIILSLFIAPQIVQAQTLTIVTDITPVHALVQAVMQDVGTPEIILPPGASPHAYSMRPSDAFALQNAALVFWIGDSLTPWLAGPISTLAADAKIITLAQAPQTQTLALREGTGIDPHIWLNPQNALYWLDLIADQLVDYDPGNAQKYRDNALQAQVEIEQVSGEIRTMLAPIHGLKYITYHDSFQYFEHAFAMPSVGWIIAGDAASPGAQSFIKTQALMTANNITCILSEPGASDAILANIAEPGTFIAQTDPVGNSHFGQTDMYPQLLRDIAMALRMCPIDVP